MKIGSFPEIVNDNAARVVAFFVVSLALAAVALESRVVTAVLVLGFTARFLYGPRFDFLARLAIHGVLPLFRIGFKPTAGAPKRFAQLVGLLFSASALGLLLADQSMAFRAVLLVLAAFASLESFFGFCAGCFAFSLLMKTGVVPEEVCEQCNNLTLRQS